jgi:hypothetical protein
MTRHQAGLFLGLVLAFVGGVSLLLARGDVLGRIKSKPRWRWLTWSYDWLDAQALAGGRARYLRLVGALLLGLGIFLVVRTISW